MTQFTRYAIYYAPEPGPLARFGAAWLGWDAASGHSVPHPALADLPVQVEKLTARPRKYGLHATLKPPFRLAPGSSRSRLENALASLAASLAPVRADGLRLARIGRFLALVPKGDTHAIAALAARVVSELDAHRASMTAQEAERRSKARLSPSQRANLDRWGYPYVMEEFRFHLTLTGPLPDDQRNVVTRALSGVLDPLLPSPFVIRDLSLFGEAPDGRFHLLSRHPLGARFSEQA
ncbi:DUF1045 domain-containing protein [Marimonas lutisalis]|uniref:DUF1045 domain-containing protein n=1 Tax=Marimonas lutisalis TaxID=2545756 RepID=UPI0010F8F473|nr:DUF1045 domain-containing protein [Marimonas lutisalis]